MLGTPSLPKNRRRPGCSGLASKSTGGPLLRGDPSSPKSLNSASVSSSKTPSPGERKSFFGL